jgi:hypothetical protein
MAEAEIDYFSVLLPFDDLILKRRGDGSDIALFRVSSFHQNQLPIRLR